MTNLLESIPTNNVKIIELYNKIDSENLILKPLFQRKLVWKKQHKFHFIETILKNFPFPEVYIASSEMDVKSITTKEIVVDGQQRLSTIVDYIKGEGDFEAQKKITPFNDLDTDGKKRFLNYLVSVRDLKNLDEEIIKEIFMRINNTEYSLNTVEKLNAQYGDSEFVIFCKQLSERGFNPDINTTNTIVNQRTRNLINDFFLNNNVFNESDMRRMNDLQYVMTLVSTLIESEYFSRNSKVMNYIERYNSEFDKQEFIEQKLTNSIKVYNELNLDKSSYWFSRTNVFTLLITFSSIDISEYNIDRLRDELLQIELLNKKYFSGTDIDSIPGDLTKYFEFGKEAVNERSARNYRAEIIKKVLDIVKKQ